jgi:hypothetical protein
MRVFFSIENQLVGCNVTGRGALLAIVAPNGGITSGRLTLEIFSFHSLRKLDSQNWDYLCTILFDFNEHFAKHQKKYKYPANCILSK